MVGLCCACSVYDPSRLPGRGESPVRTEDGGPPPRDSGYEPDAAVDDCQAEEFARCRRPNAEAACVDGKCLIETCLDGWVDCDADAANGCESRLDTAQHCGLCGATCRYNRGSARCEDGRCALAACDSGYGDCDGDPDTGCETNLATLTDCGSCGNRCLTPVNSLPGCKDGRCGVDSCLAGFGDCNGLAADGCETRLDTPDHCGACSGACAPSHGSGDCASGSCLITGCEPGFADCNGLAADGCESAMNNVEHCGGCGRSCTLAHVARPSCTGQGRCEIDKSCRAEDRDCTPGAAENGCEQGYSDCDGNPDNGCETDLSRIGNCGRCGNSCVRPNATAACRAGQCEVTGCAPDAARCEGDTACRSLASDPQHCGECGRACSEAGRDKCAGGRCTGQSCEAGRADCDQNADNGCETNLASGENCGLCGRRCPSLPHASGACRDGACGIGQCEEGWADCDGEISNGCEVNVRTNDDCGQCARPCIGPNATTSCASGSCRITQCSEGRGNCNDSVADGCESDFSLPATCGGCENQCAQLPNVASSSCDDATCKLVCGSGRADCDGRPANGCEADLMNQASCGSCGNDCTQLANVRSATCEEGNCRALVCEPGFGDCNGNPADGCERSLNTLTDCGSCDRACSPAHGMGVCRDGRCGLASCNTGHDDCNGNPADGCETSITTNQNCGACRVVCTGNSTCNNGQCGCATDADCGPGLSCCDGACADTTTACFPFPCIPGTDRSGSRTSCGGCGVIPCLLWCCDSLE